MLWRRWLLLLFWTTETAATGARGASHARCSFLLLLLSAVGDAANNRTGTTSTLLFNNDDDVEDEETSQPPTTEDNEDCEEAMHPNDNPLWPTGIEKEDVDFLVDQVMSDRSMNIRSIPDVLERQIYKSTVVLCLNAVYRALSQVHGIHVMAGHVLTLDRRRVPQNPAGIGGLRQFNFDDTWTAAAVPPSSPSSSILERYTAYLRGEGNFDDETADDGILQEVANQLLLDENVNLKFVPDAIERQLYVNCLRLIFRLLGLLASSLYITMCGHKIRLQVTRESKGQLQQTVLQNSLRRQRIDTSMIEQFIKDAGVPHSRRRVDLEPSRDPFRDRLSWWGRLVRRQSFVIKLHATLYALILGILDDLFANTKIELLSDCVTLDIVPLSTNTTSTRRRQRRGHPEDDGSKQERNVVRHRQQPRGRRMAFLHNLLSFAAGVGAMAVCYEIKPSSWPVAFVSGNFTRLRGYF